jgi:hypothetical protein
MNCCLLLLDGLLQLLIEVLTWKRPIKKTNKKKQKGSKCKNNNKTVSLQKGQQRQNQESKGGKTNSNNKATCVLKFIKRKIQTESPNQGRKPDWQ